MQRYVTQLILLSKFGRVRPAFPLVVTLTRVSSGSLDPHDNLPGSQKHLVDQIAEWLGLKNDWDPRVQWRYAQEKCARGSFSVRVKFETVAEIVPHY
jgi:hypothetical protein